MGSANVKSTVNNTNKQLFISDTLVNILNKNTNEAVANALIQNNNSCVSTKDISQIIDFSGCKVKGDINIGNVKQDATVVVDFSCLNTAKASQSMAQTMLSELVNISKNNLDTKAINDMNTKAASIAKTSGIFGGSSNADTNVNNTFDLKQINKTNTNIQNVIANSITSNFKVENIQKCIDDAKIRQKINFKNCESIEGGINATNISQIAGIQAVVNCVNKSGAVNDVMTDVANKLNIVVVSESKAETKSKIDTVVKGEATTSGITGFDCCGFGSSSTMSSVIILIFCVLCIISISGISFFRPGSSKQ
jgi:hypothetical protein